MAKFSKADLESANRRMQMLSYYPTDPGAHAAIMELLAKMCPSREALIWLVDAMVNRVGAWKGPAELRGVLCWRFTPADGVEASSSVPGFTPADGEALTLERASQSTPPPYLISADPECRKLVQSIADRRRLM
jgi:hypothetical protein